MKDTLFEIGDLLITEEEQFGVNLWEVTALDEYGMPIARCYFGFWVGCLLPTLPTSGHSMSRLMVRKIPREKVLER